MPASLTLSPDGRVRDATPDALDLLGVTLPELRSLPPGAFSPDPPDPDADVAFRNEWEAQGRPDIMGEGTLRRPDGRMIRVRFVITERSDGTFLAVLEPVSAPVDAPPRTFTAGDVLAAWRAAERRLTELVEGSHEWAGVNAEIEAFRRQYQELFQRPA